MNTHPLRRDRRHHRLLLAARDGDVEALRLLARAWGPRVWRVAALLVGEAAASELTAAVFQAALADRSPLPRPANVRVHLFRTLYTLVAASPPAESGLLEMLPMPLRAFHAMSQLEGLDYQQIAAVCDVEVVTVREGCAAARSILVAEIGTFRDGLTDAPHRTWLSTSSGSLPDPAA